MKFRIDLDITPEEFRRVMGWPDVQELHKEMLDQARQKLAEDGLDPTTMLKLFSGGSIDQFQRMMQMVSGYGRKDNNEDG